MGKIYCLVGNTLEVRNVSCPVSVQDRYGLSNSPLFHRVAAHTGSPSAEVRLSAPSRPSDEGKEEPSKALAAPLIYLPAELNSPTPSKLTPA